MTTLIEVLAAMTVSSVLLATTATVITLVFRLDRLGRDELTASIAEGRLAADLRADVRSSGDLGLAPEGPSDALQLLGPGGRSISYRSEGDDLIRVRRDGEGADRLERYRLLPGTTARWEVLGDGPSRRVALELDSPKAPKTEGAGRRLLRIEATLGRDRRFEGDDS
ncbi:PulJ/GspJ family protein [Tautonia plasticadhaerens]|nr:hypothetical protein [Tautonia plasticadhaerens]